MRILGMLRRGGAVLWSLLVTWAIAALLATRLAPRARRLLSARLARSTTEALGTGCNNEERNRLASACCC